MPRVTITAKHSTRSGLLFGYSVAIDGVWFGMYDSIEFATCDALEYLT